MSGCLPHSASRLPATFALALVMIASVLTAAAVRAAVPPERLTGVARVVVFGDVHGAYDALVSLLRAARVVDADNRWVGGKTHLVSLGDLLDRGPDSRKTMDLLMALSDQAEAAGGRVHVIMGNHELMNLTGDLRYVSPAEYAAFAADETPSMRADGLARMLAARTAAASEQQEPGAPEAAEEAPAVTLEALDAEYPPGYFAHRQAFSPDGRYGSWLLTLPAMLIINDMAFVHGGYPGWLADYAVPDIVRDVHHELNGLLATAAELIAQGELPAYTDLLDPDLAAPPETEFAAFRSSRLLGDDGPLWYRGTAYCHPLIEKPVVTAWLEHLGVKRLVVGHSPTTTRRVQARFDGHVILADTGMLTSYYHGEPAALIFEGDGVQALYPRESEVVTALPRPPVEVRMQLAGDALDTFMAGLDAGSTDEVTFEDLRFRPVFQPGDKRTIASRIAAYRLDRLLGIGMVPPTQPHLAGGKPGTLSLLPPSTITETERVARGIYRPAWCSPVPDFQLMYALDALIRNEARTQDSILYDTHNWAIQLLLERRAFGTSVSPPEYLKLVPNVLPRGLADRLQALDLEELEQSLGDLLSAREIRAIDRRRQALLDTWQVAG